MTEIEVNLGTHPTATPDPASSQPDQTISAAATDPAAAQGNPFMATDSATVQEDPPAPTQEAAASETRVSDSAITPPPKPSTPRASPAKSTESAKTRTPPSVSVSTSLASAIGLHSLRLDAMKLKSSIGQISLTKILQQQQKKKQVQSPASRSSADPASKKPVPDAPIPGKEIKLHASAAAKMTGKAQLGLSAVKGRYGFCPLRTPGGQSFGDLQQMAEAWNAADMAEMPPKQAKSDPATGILERTSIEAHVAAENAILARRVTLLLC